MMIFELLLLNVGYTLTPPFPLELMEILFWLFIFLLNL